MILGQDIWALDSGSLPWRCKGYSHISNKNNHENWKLVPSPPGVTFNMLDSTSTCVWGVDFEYQVYLFVKECDIPIRYQEFTYKYERWMIGKGWYSVTRDDAPPQRVLNEHWTLDGPWAIDFNIDGLPTDKDGWQYGNSYTSTFVTQNSATTLLRRRRLARYHRYNKMGAWAKMASQDGVKFLDVAAGGSMLPGTDNWPICVWGVSKECKVYFRTNINNINPTGEQWKEICQPDFQLAKISVGPRGQMWGITTHGQLITRSGITADNHLGTEWLEVGVGCMGGGIHDIYPTALTVASDSVWMIDCKGRVFFHKGADIYRYNTLLLTDRHDTRSTSKWVHMVMEEDNVISFKSLSCGPENQVWGLDNENKIFNRSDITLTQISGQSWTVIEDPKLKNPDASEDEAEDAEDDIIGSMPPHLPMSGMSLARYDPYISLPRSMSSQLTLNVNATELASVMSNDSSLEQDVDVILDPDAIFSTDEYSDTLERSLTLEDQDSGLVSSGVHYWKMISAGGCQGVGVRRDEINLRQAELSKAQVSVIKNCRNMILEKLREQSIRIRGREFDEYLDMVDEGGFKLKSNAKIEMDGVWQSATVFLSKNVPHGHLRFRIYSPGLGASSLETDANEDRRFMGRHNRMRYEPTVMINQTSTVELIEQVALVSLLGVKRISPNVKMNTLLLFTAKKPYKLTFDIDTDFNNWFDRVNEYVKAVHELPNVPPNQSVWAVSGDGTVYFSPPVPSCVTDHSNRPWVPIEGNFIQIKAGPRSIVWGVSPDNNLYCFTRGYGGGAHFMGEHLENFGVQRHFKRTENQRYRIFGGFQPCSKGDRMPSWADDLGNKLETGNQYKLPPSWKWISDWNVLNTDDNDPQGWLHAKNFHSPFSASLVRGCRKRDHVRLAQMNCTAPWRKIPVSLVKIARVALEQYCFKRTDELVVAWALSTDGNLLYRHGVTPSKPLGEEWVHVDIDHPLIDISLDVFCNLWAVCNDGSAYFRMGICDDNPTGNRWMHIVKPDNDNLANIYAGKYAVWALGQTGQCYTRTKISSLREYGVAWELVSPERMSCLSVSGSDQVFGIRETDRAMVSRDGVSGEKFKGASWSLVVGDVWSDVCITATSQQHHWDQIDELTSMAMARYRQTIWVRFREQRLNKADWKEYHQHCPPIFPGDQVLIKVNDKIWIPTTVDHIGTDGKYKVRQSSFFSTKYETVSAEDMIRNEPPHHTHIAAGTTILVKLSYMSSKYTECVIKGIHPNKCIITINDSSNSQYSINDIRIPCAQLSSDIFYLDGKRKHSVTRDEYGREIVI